MYGYGAILAMATLRTVLRWHARGLGDEVGLFILSVWCGLTRLRILEI